MIPTRWKKRILLLFWVAFAKAYLPKEQHRFLKRSSFLSVSRYGPPVAPENDSFDEFEKRSQEQKQQFRSLLEESMTINNPDHLPRLLANNMQLIMSMHGEDGAQVISELVEEARIDGQEQFEQTVDLVETILAFAEDFVEQASHLDSHNKHLLGKIIKAMTSKDDPARDREEYLDDLMEAEKENFTPGFLRHIEGECKRIANAPKVTPESARLLEIIRIIQTRVLEELGKDMGEAALVLGQLMGYDSNDELMGVLDAGLTVRGRDFAVEMASLTKEALDGFKRVPDVEPELVDRVSFIDKRLHNFLDETNEFQ